MTTRTSLLALAATVALATAALAPTNASAHFGGFHGGYGFHPGGGFHHGFYRWGGYRWGFHPGHYRFGYRWPYRWWFHPRPIFLGAVGGGAVAAAATTAAPAQAPAQPANCLVKQYMPSGAVAFADTCTNEQAISMPNGPQQPGQPGPGAQ
jgi:hypothetical protein